MIDPIACGFYLSGAVITKSKNFKKRKKEKKKGTNCQPKKKQENNKAKKRGKNCKTQQNKASRTWKRVANVGFRKLRAIVGTHSCTLCLSLFKTRYTTECQSNIFKAAEIIC